MKELGKIVLHIPAREGSKRVPRKNMRDMNGKPMIAYVIAAALEANVTQNMYVNTDANEIIEYVSANYPKIQVYKRDAELANDKASSDEFNYDIIRKLKPDTLIMVNPVSPLLSAKDIKGALEAYKKSDCDTLITSESTQMQTFCDGIPVNIKLDEQLAPSQDNGRITILNWAVTIWDAKKFTTRMQERGYASLGKNRLLFDIDPLHAIKVSKEKDFLFAETLLSSIR